MPFIHISTNKPVSSSDEDALKQELGKKIELIPRKTEKWLMCRIDGGANLYFGGSSEAAVYIEVKIFGNIDPDAAAKFTAEITQSVSNILAVPSDRIYVSYFSTPAWGFNGNNF